MSKLSKIFKKIILWLLGDGRIEFLLELARRVVQRLDNHDELDSEVKRKKANEEIREKLKALGKDFSSHMINLAIEMALVLLIGMLTCVGVGYRLTQTRC